LCASRVGSAGDRRKMRRGKEKHTDASILEAQSKVNLDARHLATYSCNVVIVISLHPLPETDSKSCVLLTFLTMPYFL
jgi:hypothetical protein